MKIYFESIGCRLNQSEIERMAAQARLNGHEIVISAAQADWVILNSCAVTSAASADSRKAVRSAARAGSAQVAVTGCYATISPQENLELPGVAAVVANADKDDLVDHILGFAPEYCASSLVERQALPGKHHRTRAFIKVQDGCDQHCTFCLTRIARGTSRSQTREQVFADVELALGGGVKEIVLTGVNLGAWGKDLAGKQNLATLIGEIIARFTPARLRLSSLEPWDLSDGLLDIMTQPCFCRHLHLPLQSGSDSVLKRMGRRYSVHEYERSLERIRALVPEMAITTDVMAGFPGETDEEFTQSLEFVKSQRFAGGHVFNFSARPGTPAFHLRPQVPLRERKQRSTRMRAALLASQQRTLSTQLGKEEFVLWERAVQSGNGWRLDGLTDTYVRVEAFSGRELSNEISKVRLLEVSGERITGDLLADNDTIAQTTNLSYKPEN